MAEDNIEVVVWCAQPSYSMRKRQPSRSIFHGIKINYLPSTNFPKNNILGRFANITTFSISVLFKLLFSRDKDIVFTQTTPPPLGIVISFICEMKRRNFVYILHDIFPEGLVRLGKISGRNWLIRLWDSLFLSSLKKSKKIIVIGRDMQAWIEKVYPQSLNKIEYIPLWQDSNLVFPSEFENNEFVMEYELQNKFVVQYSGNMGLWNEMETIGKAIKMNVKDVVFMIVGGGIRKEELFMSFQIAEQKNVLFLPFQPVEKLGSLLTACHAGLVSLRDGLEGMAVPSKIYGILAAGVPVIAMVPENSEIAFIVKEENCGFVVKPTDQDALINIICLLKSDENLRKSLGQNSRTAFEKKYTTLKIVEMYKSFLNKLYELE